MKDSQELLIAYGCEIRGGDCHGAGYYGAPRGKRKHKGIDIVCPGGTIVLSASDGVVTRCSGIVYADPNKRKWRYVEIEDKSGIKCRYFYVKEIGLDLGLKIKKGDVIGEAQGVEDLYCGITPHIHFETRLDKSSYIDPVVYLKEQEG